jgi:hypothetical protein
VVDLLGWEDTAQRHHARSPALDCYRENYDSRTFAITKGRDARNDDAQTKGPGAGADERTSAERDISVT